MLDNIYPIHCNNKFDKIFLTYYDKNIVKQYITFNNFRNYYYYSDYKKPIINKNQAIKQYGGFNLPESKVHDITYEADLKINKRFMLDTFGSQQELSSVPIRVCYLDIECLIPGKINVRGDDPISAISIYDSKSDNIYTFTFSPDGIEKINSAEKIRVDKYEYTMLINFLKFMNSAKFDIITGWNVYNFDIPYLCNRLHKFNLMQELSPFKVVDKWLSRKTNKEVFNIYGVSIVDYLELYKKFSNNTLSSYSLQNTAQIELEEGKLDYDGDLSDLYKNNFDKYIEYNRHDVRLVKMLEDKLRYLELLDEIRRLGMCNFDDAIHVSNVIDNMLIRFLNKSGYIVITQHYSSASVSYAGAYVKEPKPQIVDYVMCCDFKSLYPFIIMNYNISPETFLKKIPENTVKDYKCGDNEIIAFNGAIFKKNTKGIFAILSNWLFKKRVEYKKMMYNAKDKNFIKMYNTKQEAFKNILNSMYGFVGFQGSRFFNIHLAEAITLTGQALIKFAIDELTKLGYNCITSDTDSIFFSIINVNTKELSIQKGKEVSNYINNKLKEFCRTINNIDECTFDFEFEKVAERGIFFAKKHYILKLIYKDGKDYEEVDYKGVSVKKTDTSKYTKEYLKKIYDCVLNEKDYIKNVYPLIEEFYLNLEKASLDDIGLPISLGRDLKDYVKTIPMHVRGARYWEENYSKQYNLSFDNSYKGKMYLIKKYLTETDDKNDPVICIPEGGKFPAGLQIDYDRTKERLIDKQLDNLIEILDWEKAEVLLNSYLNYEISDIVLEFIKELSNDINEFAGIFLHKLHMPLYQKRFIKFIETKIQHKIFLLYCDIHKYDKNLAELILEKIYSIESTFIIKNYSGNIIYENKDKKIRDAEYRKLKKELKDENVSFEKDEIKYLEEIK